MVQTVNAVSGPTAPHVPAPPNASPPSAAPPSAATAKPPASPDPVKPPAGADPFKTVKTLLAKAHTAKAEAAPPKPPSDPGPAEAAYGAEARQPAQKSVRTFEALVPVGVDIVEVQFTVIGDVTQAFPPPFKAVGEGPPENSVHIDVAAGGASAVAVHVGSIDGPAQAKTDAHSDVKVSVS